MTHRVKGHVATTLLFCVLSQTTSATSEVMPDIELLEFLGTIAGLESMGVEIDELLAGSESAEASEAVDDAEVDKGENSGYEKISLPILGVFDFHNNE